MPISESTLAGLALLSSGDPSSPGRSTSADKEETTAKSINVGFSQRDQNEKWFLGN